jgi:hypothetical protein
MRSFHSISVEFRGNPQRNERQISVGGSNWNDERRRAEQFPRRVTFLPHIELTKSTAWRQAAT